MFNSNIKLLIIIKTVMLYMILSVSAVTEDINEIAIGPDNAVVKIKVFSSFTCPHCADFHINVLPQIKKKYVESGKVKLIFIDFPLDQAAFNASKLLNCMDKSEQINFMDIIYETQNKWASGSNLQDINNNLKKIAENLGISSSLFDKCLADETVSDKILNGRIDASKKYSIKSTPSIIINEKKLEGGASFKNIKEIIEKII